jgi:hypothetical protein
MDLKDVPDFGGIAADDDELLRECFTDHPAYESSRSRERFLVIGRKGSGKTAIYQKLLLESSPTYFAVGHTFGDYPWHHHDPPGTGRRSGRAAIPAFVAVSHPDDFEQDPVELRSVDPLGRKLV